MKTSESGQTTLLDFSLAVFVFLIAFGALGILWVNELNEKLQQQNFDEMDLKVNLAAEMLVKSPGSPTNWEELDQNSARSLGIAFADRSVDENKLFAFRGMDYDTAKKLLGISEYDFFFEFQGIDSVTTGYSPIANVDSITVTRIVEYRGSEGIAKLTIYRS